MNSESIFQALSDIEDEYIERAAHIHRTKQIKRPVWLRLAAAAACVALTASVLVGVYLYHNQAGIVYPEENTVYGQSDLNGQIVQPIYYTYEQLEQGAAIIIVADVKGAYRDLNDQGFLHYAEVEVREVLKGAVKRGESVFVHDNAFGFKDSEERYLYSVTFDGGPMLEKGNRVLLFLTTSDYGFQAADGTRLYEYVYGGVGKFFYDKDGKYRNSAAYSEEFPEDFTAGAMLGDYTPKTLEEIRRLIEKE